MKGKTELMWCAALLAVCVAGCSDDTDGAIRGELKSDRVPVIRGIDLQQPRVQVNADAPTDVALIDVTLAVLPGAEVKARTYLQIERGRLILGDYTTKEPVEGDEEPPVEVDVELTYQSQSSRLVRENVLAFFSDPFSDKIQGSTTTNEALAVLCDGESSDATLYVYFNAYYAKNEDDESKVEPYILKVLVPLECAQGS